MADPFAQPNAPSALDFTLQVECFYAALISFAPLPQEPSLGGQLLYSGHLDPEARAILVAANIAGAASLAATADTAAQKQALRSGIVDFLVNSLDEALRILKNEIRKRQTVAVCVAVSSPVLELEMHARGVKPDVVRSEGAPLHKSTPFLTWRVASAPARWLPKLDAIALQCLGFNSDPNVGIARRWLRLAPRYLGRQAQSMRLMRGTAEFYEAFVEQVRSAVLSDEIPVEVEIRFKGSSIDDNQTISPQVP